MLAPEITYLTRIFFHPGATSLLPQLLNQQGIANPLVITDKGLVALGLVEKLGLSNPVIFDEVFFGHRLHSTQLDQDLVGGPPATI